MKLEIVTNAENLSEETIDKINYMLCDFTDRANTGIKASVSIEVSKEGVVLCLNTSTTYLQDVAKLCIIIGIVLGKLKNI